MTFIPVTSGASITINWLYGTHKYLNRVYATKDGFTEADQQTLADAMMTALKASGMMTIISNDYRLQDVTVTDERTEGAPAKIDAVGGADGGSAVSALPLQSAVVVTLRTGNRGRSYRGRMYISGFTEDGIADGWWVQDTRDKALGWCSTINTQLTNNGWTWVIASKQHNGAPTSPAVVKPVTSRVIRSSIPGSQRRRNARP